MGQDLAPQPKIHVAGSEWLPALLLLLPELWSSRRLLPLCLLPQAVPRAWKHPYPVVLKAHCLETSV